MEKRRNYGIVPLAVLFFAILGLNVCVLKSIGRTNTVVDKTVIEHAQLEFFVPNKRILMQASILDPAGIAEARLYFGTSKDAKNLVFSEMKHQGDSFVGIIPAPSSKTEKIFYCFLAVNHNGDIVKTGLFELQANKNIGFIPTWQGDFNEYGETLILGKEGTSDLHSTVIASEAKQSHGLEGFADSITVNTAKPDERYFAAKKVQRVAGLSTTDGGAVEPSEEAGEPKEGWSKDKKAAVVGGAILGAGAIGGIIAAAGGGGGGGNNNNPPATTTTTTTVTTTSTTTVTTTSTTTTTTTTLPIIQIPQKTGIPPGEITFNPTTGLPGDPVSVSLCFDVKGATVGLGPGDQLKIKVDGVEKPYNVCNTFGSCGINCDLGQIFKFSGDGNHRIIFRLNVETKGFVTVADEQLALKFKD